MKMNRRELFKLGFSSMAYYSTFATTPSWVVKSANALSQVNATDDRILVIIQHSGGIDGLNTVIPRTDDIYYDAQTRPTIQVPRGLDLNLDGLNGLHPQLFRLADWYQKGMLSVINNVGYLNPNLSHFTSTDIYEYGINPTTTPLPKGWVARFYDNQCDGCDPGALDMMAAGKTSVPDALSGSPVFTPPAINRSSDYQLTANEDSDLRFQAIAQLNNLPTIDPQIDFLQRSANVVQASVRDVETATQLATLVPETNYTNNSLGRGLKLVSQIIRSGFDTKVFYVSQGGYDTHAGQVAPANPLEQGSHPRLLGDFDSCVDAFLTEMEMSGNLDRVLVMTFSEFGRRVYENGSNGTDHGAANSMFVFGGGVKGGVYGGQPDLANLIKGNLRHNVDFRSVYSEVVEGWFGSDAAPIFGQDVYDGIINNELPNIRFV